MESTTKTISTAIAMAQPGTPGAISPWCVSKHKRLFDIAASCLLLVLTFPAMVVIALLVGMSSRGPILFSQRRVGQGGKCFSLLKFRAMAHGRQDPDTAECGRQVVATESTTYTRNSP